MCVTPISYVSVLTLKTTRTTVVHDAHASVTSATGCSEIISCSTSRKWTYTQTQQDCGLDEGLHVLADPCGLVSKLQDLSVQAILSKHRF